MRLHSLRPAVGEAISSGMEPCERPAVSALALLCTAADAAHLYSAMVCPFFHEGLPWHRGCGMQFLAIMFPALAVSGVVAVLQRDAGGVPRVAALRRRAERSLR